MVGEYLRKERERQGLSIMDVAAATSIRAVYLEALEAGEWDQLPNPVYVKGFIRNYAISLKLDPADCLQKYQNEVSTADSIDGTDSSALKNTSPYSSDNMSMKGEKEGAGGRLATLAVLLVGIGLAGGWLFFGSSAGEQTPRQSAVRQSEPAPAIKEEPVPAAQPKTAAAPAPAASTPAPVAAGGAPAVATAVPQTNMGGVQIQARFSDRCWMQVIADGAVVYEGTATQGENLTWTAKDKIFITAGNAGAVEIARNGKPLGQMGEYGKVVEAEYKNDKP